METVVLGGGVIGVTTAYYLAREGHQVTVVEQRSELGQDATGGNAGLIAPGHSFAWASPAAPKMLLASLRGEATAIRVKPRAEPRFLLWGMQFLRECTAGRAKANTMIKVRLARYSQRMLHELAEAENIDYQQVQRGAVYLHRDKHELELGMKKLDVLVEAGLRAEALSPEDLARIDPAFAAAAGSLAGAVYVPSDGSGNSQLFTTTLAERCRGLGVEFRTGVTARRFSSNGNRVSAVQTDQGPLTADYFVLALGIRSPFLSRTVRQPLPVYPAKGYSITVPIADQDKAPTVPGVDEKTLVAWSRFGPSLRMSSTAEFAGYNRSWKPTDLDNIVAMGNELFPDALEWDGMIARSCLRPMTPDGPPIIGKGRRDNLYYNTGHGHMGWTMACGSSRILADLMVGRTPAVDTAGMQVRAFRH